MKRKTLNLGTFDAEIFWREPDLARLPALADPATEAIVAAMDELLFPCCQRDDLLITRFPMDPAFKHYLQRLGFQFEHNKSPLDSEKPVLSNRSVFQLLNDSSEAYWKELLASVTEIEPYAALPGTEEFCQKYSLPFKGPSLSAVAQVNSKVYSHLVAVDLGLKKYGLIVNSARELETEGTKYLQSSPFLIKDPFGVSGKGNLLIQNGNVLQRIVAYLAGQENSGRRVVLLLEPFLEKELDFSCQMRITPDGVVKVLSFQKMLNQQLAYQGSTRLEPERVMALERLGYLSQMESVVAQIYRSGYFGDVGVDSMWLKDGTLVPVVEINARKSMGLINHHLDEYLAQYQLQSSLAFLTLGYDRVLQGEWFLEKLDQAELLFTPGRPQGIIPLSTNTLTANLNRGETGSSSRMGKGRLYFTIPASLPGNDPWLAKLRGFCTEFGFKIY